MTFAEQIISFYKEVGYSGTLPEGISIMNPFRENSEVLKVATQFYHKFYNDHNLRHLILGINPGRHGAGITGIPFTDTKRMVEKCGLSIAGVHTFETSSVFVYDMIDAFGGTEKFYGKFYVSSVSPLGFTSKGKNGNEVNYNYYDSRELTDAVYDFMITSIEKQLGFGIKRDVCFCLGTGKNFKFIRDLNNEKKYFGKVMPLEHPRFIMQYKSKQKQLYISKYIEELSSVL